MSDKCERSIKQRLVNTQKTIKKKFKQAYKDRVEKERAINSTFKPVTRKIDELIELTEKQNTSHSTRESSDSKNVPSNKQNNEENSEESSYASKLYSFSDPIYDSVGESGDTSIDYDSWSSDDDPGTSHPTAPIYTNINSESLAANRAISKKRKHGDIDADDAPETSNSSKKLCIDLANIKVSPQFTMPAMNRKTTTRVKRPTAKQTTPSRLLTVQPGTSLITDDDYEACDDEIKQKSPDERVKR